MLIFVSVFVFYSKQSNADIDEPSLSRELIQTIVNKVLQLNDTGSTNLQIVEEIVSMTSSTTTNDDDDSDKINRYTSTIKKLNYGQFKKIIRIGSTGSEVESLQEVLNTLSRKLGLSFDLMVDGKYGKNTVQVVKLIQEKQRLVVDGIVGPITLAMLTNLLGEDTTVINTAPIITLNGDAEIPLTVGDPYTEYGAEATDAEDGDISGDIVKSILLEGNVVTNVSTTEAGVYIISYNVSDSEELSATPVSRVVTITADDIE